MRAPNKKRPPSQFREVETMSFRRNQVIAPDVEVLPLGAKELAAAEDPHKAIRGVGDAGSASLPIAHRPVTYFEQISATFDPEAHLQPSLAETGRLNRKSFPNWGFGTPCSFPFDFA